MTPAVTVGLMTHNYGCYIGEAIESALAQSRTDWELIISDDASTDDTGQIVAPYLSDARITYVRHEKNLGQAGNWGFLLGQGTAPIVSVLHADDSWLPHMLETVLREFEADPETDMVFGNWWRLTEDGQKTQALPNKTEALTGHALYRRQVKKFTCLASGAFLTRRVVEQAGLPNPTLKMVVDYEYFLRTAIHTRKVRTLAEPLFHYRIHSRSTTSECTANGVLTVEKERLPGICALPTKTFPMLRKSLINLRRNYGTSIFRDGCRQAASGHRGPGLNLMARGIHLYPFLLLRPRWLAAYLLCMGGGNLYHLFCNLSQHRIGGKIEAA